MPISLIAAPKFLKLKKKLPDKLQEELDNQIAALLNEPETGELKKGDLAGIRVLKFKFHSQQILLAYQYDKQEEIIYLLAVGSHEKVFTLIVHSPA
ncbi:MAG: type II toxin-antitoxin system RelE/ParE family toxin [Deltaproteobacteria bacterium]|nr:type II toxin-antitoxin system RelE/ParE family toxin [Deltaproteobacteria bacterium]